MIHTNHVGTGPRALGVAVLTLVVLAAVPVAAQETWVRREFPQPRSSARVAYDSLRQRLVLFGGAVEPTTGLGDTWEMADRHWTRRTTANSPSPRSAHVLAYDEQRGVVVLFGGTNPPSGPFGDTWEYDGVDWVQRNPTTSPPARFSHSMVYDSVRNRMLMFGGRDYTQSYGDTWEWDGTDWVELSPATVPQVRSNHGMAYDASRDRVVLFGGSGATGVGRLADTWEWDGADWIPRSPASSPPPRSGFALTWDPTRQRTVLFAGRGSGLSSETWEWDGTDWTQIASPTTPSARDSMAVAYHGGRQRVLVFGGMDSFDPRGDTWEWDGADWALSDSDPGMVGAMTYDSVRERTVVIGWDTWEWDGVRWILAANGRPGDGPMAFDAARNQTVLLVEGSNPQTWAWDGVAWTALSPPTEPRARMWSEMVYDAARQRIVLFGGVSSPPGPTLDDIWEWNGTTWTQIESAVLPPPRYGHAMAYDAGRQRVVVFGGGVLNGPLHRDTWEWDGSVWTERFPATSPLARELARMVYDVVSGRSVLFGGRDVGTSAYYGDTWEWDGTNWFQRSPAEDPGGAAGHEIVFDVARQRIVLHGGSVNVFGDPVRGTWLYGPTIPATAATYGAGCAGTAGVPALTPFGRPWIGNADFGLELRSAAASAPVALLVGAGQASVPLGSGCSLWVDPGMPIVVVPGAAGPSGRANFAIPIPPLPELIGGDLAAQAAVVDPGGAWVGTAWSNGVALRVGD